MKKFKITTRICTNKYELQSVIDTFTYLYKNLTSKHQKKLELILIEEPTMREFYADCSIEKHLLQQISFVSKEYFYTIQEATIFLILEKKNIKTALEFSFQYNLPVLTYPETNQPRLLSFKNSIIIPFENIHQTFITAAKALKMLYFDPHAQSLLKIGAKKKARQYFKKQQKLQAFQVAMSVNTH